MIPSLTNLKRRVEGLASAVSFLLEYNHFITTTQTLLDSISRDIAAMDHDKEIISLSTAGYLLARVETNYRIWVDPTLFLPQPSKKDPLP